MSIHSKGDGVVVGALVRWIRAKTCGVITEIDERVIRVRWDCDDSPPQFAVADPPLERVALQGQTVRIMSTGEDAAVLSPAEASTPAWQCFVAAGNGGRVANFPEADLRPILITDPVSRFQANRIGSLQKYRLQEVTRWYRLQHLYDDLISLGQVGVDIKPHQVSVAHRVISNYPHRFLLCDEVGLGKTIEAGMVLKELRARGGGRRVLVIVPPSLVRQWQFEMKTKFNESFSVLNSDTVRYMRNQGQTDNPFTYYDSVLCSSGWIANPKWAGLCSEVDWDLVVLDEAHHARSRRSGNRVSTTRLYRLIRSLATPEDFSRRGMLFLTATPMQLDTHELYSLVELLDPALFPSEDHFERHRKAVPGLSQLVELLHLHGFPLPGESPEDTAIQISNWLELEVSAVRDRLSAGKVEVERIADELTAHHLLSEVLIRNRKAVVGGFMPRIATRWKVELTTQERTALQAIEEYVQYGYQLAEGTNDNAVGFVMVVFQKLMASSIAAIKGSLNRRREKIGDAIESLQASSQPEELEERLDNDDNAADVVGTLGATPSMVNEELCLLNRAIAHLDRVKGDSKANVLAEQLSKLFDADPNEKVLLFTEFRETQRHLGELLSARGWGVNTFHGQMKPEQKDLAVEGFRTESGPQILISTEAGGEGRNFQFCHMLVNYDLPWNPMRVEQRIGRVDRIGQDSAVSIFNLWVKDSIEEYVLDVLENRISVFEETVGGLDPILGEAESDMRKIMRIAGEERERALEKLGSQLEGQVRRARDAEKQLGDFIMDTKSYRREIAERIAGQSSPVTNEDLDRFIGQLLSDVQTHIKRTGKLYELTFQGDFRDTHTHLLPAGPKRRAVFRPDRRPDAEDVEFMAFGHPIIDAVVRQVLDDDYEGVTGTRRLPADSDLSPSTGWLFTYQFTVPGPRISERLEPVFVSDNGEIDVNVARSLLQRACQFDASEEEIKYSEIPDNLMELKSLALGFAESRRESLQEQAESQSAGRVDQEVSRLSAWFDYRERAAIDRVEATRSILNRIRESDDELQRQILPVWEANLKRDRELQESLAEERVRRIAEAKKHRYPQVSWALKALARIEIEKS